MFSKLNIGEDISGTGKRYPFPYIAKTCKNPADSGSSLVSFLNPFILGSHMERVGDAMSANSF